MEKINLVDLMNKILQLTMDHDARERHESTYGTWGFKLSKPSSAFGLPS